MAMKSYVNFSTLLLLMLSGSLLQSSALVLPTQTTTTTTSSPIQSEESDELYTTKRNAQVYFDLPKPTQFPLPVVNAEIRQTTIKSSATNVAIKVTSTTTSAPTVPPRRGSSESPLYRLNGSNGQACILLQVDSIITVKYKSTLKETLEADVYIPDDAKVTGSCDSENIVTMSLKWDAFVLSWTFAKTPGGERWYVEKIELTYNSSDKHFEHIDEPNKTIRVSTGSSMLFPTPVGKSYSCDEEQEILLTDGKHHASVLLRAMKLQPFKFKNNDFAVEFSCTALSAKLNRDETAPVAVGSTLAAVVLLTITGYAGWRHFKIKKVNYDTME